MRISVMAVVLSMPAGFVAAGYTQEHLFPVKGVVVDPSGAVIQQAEVVFKGESGTIISHTGMDGSVNVNLEAGKYLVAISAYGFATTKLVDFSVPRPTAPAFQVRLKLDHIDFGSGSDNGHSGILSVATVPSELLNVIKDDPTRPPLPVVQPAATKRRSPRCLYLWNCSASRR